MPVKHTHTATLIQGRVYRLMIPNAAEPQNPSSLVFERGKPVPVTPEIMAHLKTHAVRQVTVGKAAGRKEQRSECQFESAGIDGSASAQSAA